MKPFLQPAIALSLAASATATTLAVLPGEAIQPKVDAAAPGDIIAIFGGTYPGDVTITKAIRLVEVDGQEVTITGNVTWTGVTNAPPFEGFTVGSPGKGITVNNTTGLVIKNVDGKLGSGITSVGSSVTNIISSEFSAVSQDGGDLTASDVVTTGSLSSTSNSQKTIIFRFYVGGDVSLKTKACWFGYSSAQKFNFSGNESKVLLINSKINSKGRGINAVDLQGQGNNYLICNNSIEGVTHGVSYNWYPEYNYPGRGLWISGNYKSALILNNYFSLNWNGHYEADNGAGEAMGISGASTAMICNNIVVGARYGIKAPFGVDARNNHYYGLIHGNETGGVVAFASSTGNPLFVSGQTLLFQSSSPCINAGVNDPIFNDIDGTRNDIGPGGGCLFDPEGWTTNKPVVISFDLAPQQLLKGVDTQVILTNGQAVAQP